MNRNTRLAVFLASRPQYDSSRVAAWRASSLASSATGAGDPPTSPRSVLTAMGSYRLVVITAYLGKLKHARARSSISYYSGINPQHHTEFAQ
jgi:hypothetical protein